MHPAFTAVFHHSGSFESLLLFESRKSISIISTSANLRERGTGRACIVFFLQDSEILAVGFYV